MRADEHGQEDIFKEAVSLLQRIEVRYSADREPAVLGVNSAGWLFVYLGSGPMYRFDETGRLRRAFVDGQIYRTTGKTLAVMRRERDHLDVGKEVGSESLLLRSDLSARELESFRIRMLAQLKELSEGLNSTLILRQIISDGCEPRTFFLTRLQHVSSSTEFLAPPIVRR